MSETCPECSALVTDIGVHQAWHYEVITRDRLGRAIEAVEREAIEGPPIGGGS